MRHDILVGTHQKTGTVWMHEVFKGIATAVGARFLNVSRHNTASFAGQYRSIEGSSRRSIVFDNHAHFPKQCLQLDFRGLRLIRDPRDMVISAVRYHQDTTAAFANRPKQELGGKSIRAHISGLETLDEKLIFEIDYAMTGNITDMARYAAGDRLKAVKYEALIDDRALAALPHLLVYLGFDDDEAVVALCIFWELSLFGLKARDSNRHIRNGRARQFEQSYSPKVLAAFDRKYPGMIAALGYDAPPELDPAIRALVLPPALVAARDALVATPGAAAIDRALEAAVPHLERPGAPHIAYARYLLGAGAVARAEDAAWRALEIDERMPEASIAFGEVCLARADPRGAERAFRTALALAPGSKRAAARLAAVLETPAAEPSRRKLLVTS